MAGMVVPRYEQSTVQNAAVAIPQAQAPGADSFGAGLGQGLSRAGNVGLEIAKDMQDKADVAAIDNAKGQILTAYNRISTEAQVVTGRGVDPGFDEDGKEQPGAPGLTEQYMGEFQEQLEQTTKGLTPRQMEKFKPFLTEHTSGLERALLTHEITQREAYQKAASTATAKMQTDQLVEAPDEKSFAAGVTRLDETLGHLFQGEVLEQKRKELIDGAQKQRVVNAITSGDVKGARTIFDGAGFDPKSEEYADLKHRLDGAEADDLGTSFVAGIWQQPMNNAPVANVVELYQGIESAVKNGQLTKEAAKIAEAELSQRITRYEHERTAALQAFNSDVWQGIDDGKLNLRSALAKVDAAAMPGDDRVQLKKAIERYFKPPADPEAKLMEKLGQDSALADLMLKINNGEMRVKTLKEAQAYTSLVGRGNVGKLFSYGQQYETALASPHLTGQQFDQVVEELRGAGVADIPAKKRGSANNPVYLAMQASILDQIVSKQVKTGKMLDDQGVKQEFRRILTEKVPVNARQTFMGIPLWKTTDQKRSWEVQNPGAVDVAGILRQKLRREPRQAEIDAATAALRKPSPGRRTISATTRSGGVE